MTVTETHCVDTDGGDTQHCGDTWDTGGGGWVSAGGGSLTRGQRGGSSWQKSRRSQRRSPLCSTAGGPASSPPSSWYSTLGGGGRGADLWVPILTLPLDTWDPPSSTSSPQHALQTPGSPCFPNPGPLAPPPTHLGGVQCPPPKPCDRPPPRSHLGRRSSRAAPGWVPVGGSSTRSTVSSSTTRSRRSTAGGGGGGELRHDSPPSTSLPRTPKH